MNNEIVIAHENLDEDYETIQDFIKGNENAFTKLVYRHREKVKNLIYLTLSDAEYIDDISQDVFINVYHKVKEFRFESKFTTWLYRITINKCRDYLRKKKVRSIFSSIGENEEQIKGKSQIEDFDKMKILRQAIEKLPDKLKTPLLLRDIEGYSYNEICEQLHLEIGTIKSRIFRAREFLRAILEPYQKDLI
ncbi:MAG: sigma-70 family RNA polymerase sigma factor [Ignavibacteriales bacterium]|nr:sigma-70 family RNA polymerase sigma factor [Ignavibacteriales bacterium]